jgi:hypothetical protein
MLLATTGVISVYLVSVADGTTWKAVWIGVASTMFASGLVDASVQIDSMRREQAVLRIAGQRVARINQNVLRLISSAFDLQVDVSKMHATLAELTDHEIDLSAVAPRVFPEQTKLQGVVVYLAEIDQSLEFAVTLGSLTYAAARLERLERCDPIECLFARDEKCVYQPSHEWFRPGRLGQGAIRNYEGATSMVWHARWLHMEIRTLLALLL